MHWRLPRRALLSAAACLHQAADAGLLAAVASCWPSLKGLWSCHWCAEREIVRDIKEKLGYVALDYEQARGCEVIQLDPRLQMSPADVCSHSTRFQACQGYKPTSACPVCHLSRCEQELQTSLNSSTLEKTFELPDGQVRLRAACRLHAAAWAAVAWAAAAPAASSCADVQAQALLAPAVSRSPHPWPCCLRAAPP